MTFKIGNSAMYEVERIGEPVNNTEEVHVSNSSNNL